jgi:putative addiction module component (TIGR02574 family)
MSPSSEQLLNAALALSYADRLELVEALIVSLHPDDEPPFDPAWREVIEKRAAELRSGAVSPVPWEQVKQQAREKLGG